MLRFVSLHSVPSRIRCRVSGLLHDVRSSSSTAAGRTADITTRRCNSSVAAEYEDSESRIKAEIRRLKRIRNVGVFAHVDAGKTTVTERMLALAGVIRRVGSVDDGNTVTDWLPAERERGITIQCAAISFEWGWHNNRTGDDMETNDNVDISLIDNPGHIDFSVEVNRTVAVLDGAVLVVDAVAGVQAQTETVWKALTRPTLNNHDFAAAQGHAHEPLPCLALVNKMDKEGCHFGLAIESLRRRLPGANPIPIQLPLFRATNSRTAENRTQFPFNVMAVPIADSALSYGGGASGDFVGVVDLIHMRAIVWPDATNVANVENCVPEVIPLMQPGTHIPIHPDCPVTQEAMFARAALLEQMANCDETMEDYFLSEREPSNAELRVALRRATLANKALPVMTGAALRGKGVEPLLDAIADLLPSPLDRSPPALRSLDDPHHKSAHGERRSNTKGGGVIIGHPLHPSLLALAFKVVHMKGRGGSGDGRIVFARVYSGEMRERDAVHVIAPPPPGEMPESVRLERIGGMLELAGGNFDKLEGGVCRSGDVCALVGLKTVKTGDTIFSVPDRMKGKKRQQSNQTGIFCLAGVASPKPVLKVRLEVDTTEQQTRLSEALALLSVEDPSLVVEETDSSTLLSGLGELHIEITLDRLQREFGLQVHAGAPYVEYRESIIENVETTGLCNYDKTVGGIRMQAAVHLMLAPAWCSEGESGYACMSLAEPIVVVNENVRAFLGLDPKTSHEDLLRRSDVYKALVQGCQGALKRGPVGSYPMVNMKCEVLQIDAEDGLGSLSAMPGALRAAAANAVSTVLSANQGLCTILEPTMSVEISLPNDLVGTVLSDLTSRRGQIEDVLVGDAEGLTESKALIRGDVPLVEILGYANSLRSLTGGEAAFTAEYKGHSPSNMAV